MNASDTDNSSRNYRRHADVVTREIAGETLLVPVRGRVASLHRVFSLNPVGAFIWNALDGRTTLEEAVTAVCETFEISREEATKDCREFVGELVDAGLLEEV